MCLAQIADITTFSYRPLSPVPCSSPKITEFRDRWTVWTRRKSSRSPSTDKRKRTTKLSPLRSPNCTKQISLARTPPKAGGRSENRSLAPFHQTLLAINLSSQMRAKHPPFVAARSGTAAIRACISTVARQTGASRERLVGPMCFEVVLAFGEACSLTDRGQAR